MSLRTTDLGVQLQIGRRHRCAVASNRTSEAIGRFGRVGQLPVPFARRCQLAQASASAQGTYGTAIGPPPVAELRRLRAAARKAVTMRDLEPFHVFGYLLDGPEQDQVRAITKTLVATVSQEIQAKKDQVATTKKTGGASSSSRGAKAIDACSDMEKALAMFKV